MTGDYDSVIGMDKAGSLQQWRTDLPGQRLTPAMGEAMLCGVYGRDRRPHRPRAPDRAGARGARPGRRAMPTLSAEPRRAQRRRAPSSRSTVRLEPLALADDGVQEPPPLVFGQVRDSRARSPTSERIEASGVLQLVLDLLVGHRIATAGRAPRCWPSGSSPHAGPRGDPLRRSRLGRRLLPCNIERRGCARSATPVSRRSLPRPMPRAHLPPPRAIRTRSCPIPPIKILPGEDRRLRNGSPWLFSNELRMDADAKAVPPGSLVRLMAPSGKMLGVAQFNPHSLIAARHAHPQQGCRDRPRLRRPAPCPRPAAARASVRRAATTA